MERNMEKKENRKIRYTRMVIKESFLELLKTKRFDRITVKEITDLADINRATFYAHYNNSEDLTREIELEMADKVISAMSGLYSSADYENLVVDALFDLLPKDKEMCMWMLDDNVTGCGREKIYAYAAEHCIPRWKEVGGLTEEHAEEFLKYIYSGAIGYLKAWYETGFAGDADDKRNQFRRMIHCTLGYVYGQRN